MLRTTKFWLFALVCAALVMIIVAAVGFHIQQNLIPSETRLLTSVIQEHFDCLVAGVVLVLGILGFGLDIIYHIYILPIVKITEETALIFSTNPSHKIILKGNSTLAKLAKMINLAGEQFSDLNQNLEKKISDAKTETEREKNILASIMAELPQGVLILNNSGRIILYNRQAKHIFSPPKGKRESFIGLGRSIFNIIDRNHIVHAVNEIEYRLNNNKTDIVSSFLYPIGDQSLFRFETVPILNAAKKMTGIILVFKEITHKINQYEEMKTELKAVNLDKLTDILSKWMSSQWPLVRISVKELLETLQHKAGHKLGIRVNVLKINTITSIKVEIYSFTGLFMHILGNLSSHALTDEFDIQIERLANEIHLDFFWRGSPVSEDQINRWKNEKITINGDFKPFFLSDIMEQHGIGICASSVCASSECASSECASSECASTGQAMNSSSWYRLIMPAKHRYSKRIKTISPVYSESRPEFFDFDLFERNLENTKFLNQDLHQLPYTVFDMETTGLNPNAGDEILSIGAVRIVNDRLLYTDNFECFVDPKRSIPAVSFKIHGIKQEMVKESPDILQVLPHFHEFTKDTILLGHNLAFDMKMLQLKEGASGVVFDNLLIDTLLLSAVVHPLQTRHNMAKIAKRLGVSIMGRHTALGDAITTAEIFLKLIPLLKLQGIHTLGQAIEASKKTYLARLKY